MYTHTNYCTCGHSTCTFIQTTVRLCPVHVHGRKLLYTWAQYTYKDTQFSFKLALYLTKMGKVKTKFWERKLSWKTETRLRRE